MLNFLIWYMSTCVHNYIYNIHLHYIFTAPSKIGEGQRSPHSEGMLFLENDFTKFSVTFFIIFKNFQKNVSTDKSCKTFSAVFCINQLLYWNSSEVW